MAKVDLKEMEKKAEVDRLASKSSGVEEKDVGGKKLFKGQVLPDWYDDYGECLMANTEAKRQAEYKKAGFDEFGRSPDQVALLKAKASLAKERDLLLEKANAINVEIGQLKIKAASDLQPEKTKAKKE